ncbi:antitermination protein [Escherichia coli]
MSMELMVKAMKIRVGNPLRKLVLIKLADNASDQGECWPSYQHIADQCEISKRSVMNHIAALCESGLVKKVTRKGEKGNSSNIYLLHLDGAGDSLGGSANNSLSGAANSPGSAGVAPGGSAGDSPRTSHSFEPVRGCKGKGIVLDEKRTRLHGTPVYKVCGRCNGNRFSRLPTTLARLHVQKLVPDLTDYQWYKGYADVIDKLVTKCWQEEAYAEIQLRKVTR